MRSSFENELALTGRLQQRSDHQPRIPLFHVPHDGNEFPEELFQSVCIPTKNFMAYHDRMMDKDVHLLIPPEYRTIENACAFRISRLLCDVERFIGPEEVMEQYGMGFCYEKVYDGTIIKKVTSELRKATLKYYDAHHREVNRLCEQHRSILFFDLHSYSNEIVPIDHLQIEKELPDLCIGVDKHFTPPKLEQIVLDSFQDAGLTVAINYPYSGCYIPESISVDASDFFGLMLEFHRKAYLNKKGQCIPGMVEKIHNIIRLIIKTCRFLLDIV